MGLYNFQPRFVPAIESGRKTQTIRATRRHPDAAGDTLHLYTGLRQRGARLIKRVRCTEVREIQISEWGKVRIDGVLLGRDERDKLARDDGFGCFRDMLEFWWGRLPFRGQIIFWE
jgi:hypothetical protein